METNTKGGSAGIIPNQVNKIKSAIKNQKTSRPRGEKTTPPTQRGVRKGYKNKTRIDIKRPITPPNLLGIERRMAYANKKYHSG